MKKERHFYAHEIHSKQYIHHMHHMPIISFPSKPSLSPSAHHNNGRTAARRWHIDGDLSLPHCLCIEAHSSEQLSDAFIAELHAHCAVDIRGGGLKGVTGQVGIFARQRRIVFIVHADHFGFKGPLAILGKHSEHCVEDDRCFGEISRRAFDEHIARRQADLGMIAIDDGRK